MGQPAHADRDMVSPLIAIVGPTASGKTDLALSLSRTWPVEIIVADSRQVYRGMDIGTAKPDAAARAEVPHHMLDLVAPDEAFSVASWVQQARVRIGEIAARGRIPLVVGGTGLYVSALLDGHDYAALPRSAELREQLLGELDADGLEPLAERLVRLDPEGARRVDLRNPRRVLQALERARGSTRPAPTRHPYAGRTAILALARPRAELYRRIDERASRLFAAGLLDEVAQLLAAGFGAELHPMTGHGYRESIRHLAGEWSLDEAITVTARRTRQYAKRQLTWFRHHGQVLWLPAGSRDAADPEVVSEADRLVRAALS